MQDKIIKYLKKTINHGKLNTISSMTVEKKEDPKEETTNIEKERKKKQKSKEGKEWYRMPLLNLLSFLNFTLFGYLLEEHQKSTILLL